MMEKSNISICCLPHEAILYSSIRLSNKVGTVYFSEEVSLQLLKLGLQNAKFKAQKIKWSVKSLITILLYFHFLITHDQTKLAYYEILRRRTPDHAKPNLIHHMASWKDLVYGVFDVLDLLQPDVNIIVINDPIFSKRIIASFLIYYSEKFSLALKVFGCVNSVLYHLSKDRKFGHSFIRDLRSLDELNIDEVETYYQKRISGSSNYEDANRAFQPTQNTSIYKDAVVLYLHVFRDTPFHTLENDRIFFEYVDWVYETVKYCIEHKIKIVLKMHPSARVWGENQYAWIYKILGTFIDSSFVHLDNQTSNFCDVFAHCRNVVTFSGNVKYEYAMFGKKPIVIMSGQNELLTDKLFTKPDTRNTYFSSLQADAFLVKPEDVCLAKKIVYYLEAISPLYAHFDIGTPYRGTSSEQMMAIQRKRVSAISKHEPRICLLFEATLFD